MRRGVVIWITGLPSSGKSTFAAHLERQLWGLGTPVCTLDSDRIRECLVPPPGYDETARAQFYETLTRLSTLLATQGLTVLVPATANRRNFRDGARRQAPSYLEVYIDVSSEECRARDAKGLYAESSAGGAPTLPGAGSPYEPPLDPEVVAFGGEDTEAVLRVLRLLDEVHRAKPGIPP